MSRWVSVTVDLDPLDCYLRNRGLDRRPESNPQAVYDDGLPRLLDLLDRLDVRATLFAVGQDALHEPNARLLRDAVARGHEVASHSHTHPHDFAALDAAAIRCELAAAEAAIERATGIPVLGFRAPSWNVSVALFALLGERGYRYDSSLVPLPSSRLWGRLPQLAPGLFGGPVLAGQGRWPKPPSRPYRVAVERPWTDDPRSRLWELPHGVTGGLIPLPLNATALALLGESLELRVARWAARQPEPLVVLLHGLDLVDYDCQVRDPRLRRKPGLTAPIERKLRRVERLLGAFGRGRRWTRLCDLVDALALARLAPPP